MRSKNNNRNHIVGAMRLAMAMITAMLLVSCATIVKTEPPQTPAISVLIVTGAGMVPVSSSDPRYEQTWLHAASKYTEGLTEAMKASGVNAQVYIKKDRNEPVADVVARLVAEDRKDALLQVTVRHVRTSSDNTTYLEAELMPLEYQFYSDGKRKAVPRKGAEKSYPILSTTRPDLRQASITDMGKGFVKELRAQKYLQ